MNSAISRALHPDNDRQVSRCWQEWEISGRERRVVLCVETAMEMRPGYPGFDPAKLEGLVDEATELSRASASPIDSIRIVPQH
jgi:hypothetical protein